MRREIASDLGTIHCLPKPVCVIQRFFGRSGKENSTRSLAVCPFGNLVVLDVKVAPAQAAVGAVEPESHRVGRSFDANLHEALEERGAVVVERRRHGFRRRRPGAQVLDPQPQRPLPRRRFALPGCPSDASARG